MKIERLEPLESLNQKFWPRGQVKEVVKIVVGCMLLCCCVGVVSSKTFHVINI